MWFTIAMSVLAFLAFLSMLGAKTENVSNNATRICLVAVAAAVLGALILGPHG